LKEFIINNIWWFLGGSYFLGALLYYKMAFVLGRQKNFSEMVFEDLFVDILYVVFWLPVLVLIVIKLILASIFYIPLKIWIEITKKKKD
jgi:hypothetical protein